MSDTVSQYDPVFQAAGQEWNVDPLLLKAMATQESGGNPQATSKAGAQGVMQIIPSTQKALGVTDPTDPVQSIYGGAKYMAQALDAEPTPEAALMYYHGGPDWRDKVGSESKAYVPAVTAHYQQLASANTPTTDATPAPQQSASSPYADFLTRTGATPSASSASTAQPDYSGFLARTGAAAPQASAQSSYPMVPAHPAPDGSGMTNLSDADYAKFQANVPPPSSGGTPGTAIAVGSPPAVPIADPTLTNNPDMPPGAAQPVQLTPEERIAATAGTAGLVRGVRDMIDPAAGFLARHLSPYVGGPSGADVATGNANALSTYNQNYAGNPLATAGRVAGQMLTTIPVMAAVNPIVGAAGDAIGAGVGAISPMVGRAVQAGANFLGGNAGGSGLGGRLLQAGSNAAQGAGLGAETAALTSGQSNQPLGEQMAQGAVTGGVLGAGVPAVIGAGTGVKNALTGISSAISPEVAQLAQLARDRYGIQLKAPQLGLSPSLTYANSALKMVPGSGAGAEDSLVRSQWQRAISREMGENATQITPDVLSNALSRSGGVMERIESGAKVGLDDQFVHRASQIESDAQSSLTEAEYGVVKRQLDSVMKNLEPGDTLSGTTYGNLIHKGSPLDAALNSSDSNIRNYAGQIKGALQSSLSRSLSPEDAAAYQKARYQYKVAKTVQPLTLGPDAVNGPQPSIGEISPAKFRMAVNRSFGNSIALAAPGEVPMRDLARIGERLKEPPSSGTAERGSLMYAGLHAAELAGAYATGHYAGLLPAAAGVAGGVVGGRLASSYLRSNWLANRLINSGVSGPAAVNPLAGQLQRYVGPLGVLAKNALT